MRKSFLAFTASVLLFVGAGCQSGNVPASDVNQQPPAETGNVNSGMPEPAPSTATLGSDVTLAVGGAVSILPDGLQVKLERINDSRCKPDVQCIWQGELGPEFSIVGGTAGSEKLTVLLGTVRTLQADAGGYTFSLRGADAASVTFAVTTAALAPLTDERIQVDNITSGQTVSSPLTVTGKARGTWYFEASFPARLLDANGTVLAQTPAQAQGEWMTEDFVPFKVTLTFDKPTTPTGTLMLVRDNPSGLPQNEASISIPIKF